MQYDVKSVGKVKNHILVLNAYKLKMSWKLPEKLASMIKDHFNFLRDDRFEINHHSAEEDFALKRKEKLKEERKGWQKKQTTIVTEPNETKNGKTSQ